MKMDVTQSLVQLEKTELEKLVAQVKETVATDYVLPVKESSFSAADLWRLQQKMKTAGKRWSTKNRALFIRG